MALYDREYMREGKGGTIQTQRRQAMPSRIPDQDGNRLTRGEQIGMVVAALAMIGLLLSAVIF